VAGEVTPPTTLRSPLSDTGSHFAFESEDVIDAKLVVAGMPQLAEGTELIGEYQGSGFQEPRYILRRADGQVIQLPRLSYLLASIMDSRRDLKQVAMLLSVEFGRGFRRSRCLI
jgi:putative peptide zinc metalloprotease protein